MKKIVLLLLLSMPAMVFAQTANESSKNKSSEINFTPTEITASAVLELNYEGAQNLIYKVFKNGIVVEERTIEKSNAPMAKKLDFTTLEAGSYSVKLFVAETEIKQFAVIKL